MASFAVLTSGWIRARIRMRGWPPISKTFPTRRMAEEWSTVTESELLRGVYVSRTSADRTTFKDVAEKYRDEVLPGKRGGTRDAYTVNRMIEVLGALSLTAITPAKLASYRDKQIKAGLSPQTIVHHLGIVSRILSAASMDWGMPLPQGNPVAQTRKPPVTNARTRRLLPGEEDLLLASCRKSKISQLAAVVEFAIETAARQSEILSLVWTDVNLENGTVRLRGVNGNITKNGAPYRSIPLSPRAKRVLELAAEKNRRKKGSVFNLTENSLKKAWRAAVTRARTAHIRDRLILIMMEKGVPEETIAQEAIKIFRRGGPRSATPPSRKTVALLAEAETSPMLVSLRFHDLRHEATSRLAEIFQLHELMKITGHGDSKMLSRYYHPRASDLAKRFE